MSRDGEQKGAAAAINSQGDLLVETTGRHGPDVSSQRTDALDLAALEFARKAALCHAPAVAVDLGAGLGAQTARFVAAGMSVLMVDLVPRQGIVDELNLRYGQGRVSAFVGDVRRMPPGEMPREVHILYSQRMLHYLRHAEAARVLAAFAGRMAAGARLFLSCACLESELSGGYSALGEPLGQRFGLLAPAMAQKHDVHEPLCLYARDEFLDLAGGAGFKAIEAYRSDFGTLKGVFERC